VIQHITDPSPEVQMAHLKQHGANAIRHIQHPAPEVQMAAVKANPEVIRHIVKPTPAVKAWADSNLPNAITEGCVDVDTASGTTRVQYTAQHIRLGLTPAHLAAAMEWRDGQTLSGRKTLESLAEKAVLGGPLQVFHPGAVTVYRGVPSEGRWDSFQKTGTSWTRSRRLAKQYTAPGKPTLVMRIDENMPAIDLNALLRGNASDAGWGRSEREVFVAPGRYSVETLSQKTRPGGQR
jgi:hypothetical protein